MDFVCAIRVHRGNVPGRPLRRRDDLLCCAEHGAIVDHPGPVARSTQPRGGLLERRALCCVDLNDRRYSPHSGKAAVRRRLWMKVKCMKGTATLGNLNSSSGEPSNVQLQTQTSQVELAEKPDVGAACSMSLATPLCPRMPEFTNTTRGRSVTRFPAENHQVVG
jgi:hypothetical protein